MATIKNTANTEKKRKTNRKFKAHHYPCSYCSKTFTDRSGRDHHLQLHSSERPFSCTLCPHTCKTKKYLAKHVRVVHKTPTSNKCEYCDKMFHFKSTLDKHIVVHTNAKPYKCTECNKGFNSQYSLKTHTLIHKDLKPYKCKHCKYACRDSSTLRKHEERHMGIVTRYTCNLCDKRFSNKELLQFHVAEFHMKLNLKTIPCEICNKMFRTKKLMNVHIEIRHNRKLATTCEICGLQLANKYYMKTHLMSHVDVRPYKCAFSGCDKRYKDPRTLQKHSRIHYPDQQFPCNICGKKFTRKERMKKHKKQHVPRIKNVQCDYCGVCFYNKNYLLVHIGKKHSLRKTKFICDMCDFKCGSKPGLIRHIKGHDIKMDKECPVCMKKYKQQKWLKVHLWQVHKVILSTGQSTLVTDIKIEPIDEEDGVPQFELFEIEKEEILDNDIHSISDDVNLELDNATQIVTEECNEILEENKNIVTTRDSDDSKEDNTILPNNESSLADSTQAKDVQLKEYGSETLRNDNEPNIICRKDVSALNENSIHNSTDGLRDTDNIQKTISSNEMTEGNTGNEEIQIHCSSNKIQYNDTLDNSNVIIEDENSRQNIEDQDLKEILEQNDDSQIEQCSETVLSQDKNEIRCVTETQPTIRKVGISKGKSLADIKASLDHEKKVRIKKRSKRLRDLTKKQSNTKRKTLAQIKAALMANKQSVNNVTAGTKRLSETEELEQGSEDSNAVLTEDIDQCMTQKNMTQKIKDPAEKFDDFIVERIVRRDERPKKKEFLIDKHSQSYARKFLDKLLKKNRNYNELKLIEKTRQQYNQRIRKARKIRPEKVSITYFGKTSRNNGVGQINPHENDEKHDSNIDNIIERQRDLEAGGDNKKYDRETIKEDKSDKTDNNLKESDNPTQEQYTNINGVNEQVIENRSNDPNKESNDVNEEPTNNERANVREETETDRIRLRSKSSNKKHTDDDGRIKNMDGCRKIKLNTHQCYVCFKLFESKDKLLDHCKDHFEVCNSTILKKCPLCDFSTNLNIVQHMKVEHDVEIIIPSTRIVDKESEDGPRYCYKVNSASITDIDVIPSVKHLNKQAYIAIDKKNRKLKDTGIAKTKLVKKGNEWIVERKTTRIDNVEEFILPEFDVDEILSVNIESNDYLSRMKKLYRLAKKHKKNMLFPCESCDKICQTLSALKLHYRRHDPKSKPFKKKVWKHKMNEFIQPKNKKVSDVDYGKKKYNRVVEIDNVRNDLINDNRYKKPKPVVNRHKCNPELIQFYENNIKGGDIEFWQFLKIFNKMSRENINDFNELNERPEFGIHTDETNENRKDNADVNDNGNEQSQSNKDNCNSENISNGREKHTFKTGSKNRFIRFIRMSKRNYQRRNDLKQMLRDKIARENLKT